MNESEKKRERKNGCVLCSNRAVAFYIGIILSLFVFVSRRRRRRRRRCYTLCYCCWFLFCCRRRHRLCHLKFVVRKFICIFLRFCLCVCVYRVLIIKWSERANEFRHWRFHSMQNNKVKWSALVGFIHWTENVIFSLVLHTCCLISSHSMRSKAQYMVSFLLCSFIVALC